jgi:hypothetical protein
MDNSSKYCSRVFALENANVIIRYDNACFWSFRFAISHHAILTLTIFTVTISWERVPEENY